MLVLTSSMKMDRWCSMGSMLDSGLSKSGGTGEMNLGQAFRKSSSKMGRDSGPPRCSLSSWSPYFSRSAVWIVSSRRVGWKATQMAIRASIWSFFCSNALVSKAPKKSRKTATSQWISRCHGHTGDLTRIFGDNRKNSADLGDRIVLGTLLELLGPRNVDEDVAEHADGVGVAAHHHVGEPNIVVGREVGSHDTGEHGLLVELDVVEGLEGEAEVAEKAVDAQQADDGEVAKHAVEALGAVLAGDRHGVLIATSGSQLLQDVGPLDQGVEHVEDAVAAPRVGVLTQSLDLLLVVGLSRDSHTVGGEGVELVDELIDDIPSPVVLRLQVSLAVLVRDQVGGWVWGRLLTDGGSRSTGPSELRMKWNRLQ